MQPDSLNRTMLELKYAKSVTVSMQRARLNRTMLELKSVRQLQ